MEEQVVVPRTFAWAARALSCVSLLPAAVVAAAVLVALPVATGDQAAALDKREPTVTTAAAAALALQGRGAVQALGATTLSGRPVIMVVKEGLGRTAAMVLHQAAVVVALDTSTAAAAAVV